MDRAGYKLEIGKDLSTPLNYTIAGSEMHLAPVSIEADDGAYCEVIEQVNQTAAGEIDPTNPRRLVFAGAFGKGIDLVLQALPDGFHQDVIFHDAKSLKLPDYFDAKDVDIRLYTELNLDDYCDVQGMKVAIGRGGALDSASELDWSAVTQRRD